MKIEVIDVKKKSPRFLLIEIAVVVMGIILLTASLLRQRHHEAVPREIASLIERTAQPVKPSKFVPIPPGARVLMSLRIPGLPEGCDDYVRIACEGEPAKVADWCMKDLADKGRYPPTPRWNPSPKKGKELLERLALAPSSGQWELGASLPSTLEHISIFVHGGGGESIIEYFHYTKWGAW